MIVTVFNTTNAPVVLDDEGRVCGGRDWAPASTTEQRVKDRLDDGTLVVQDAPAKSARGDLRPEALAAHDRTAEIKARAEQASDLEVDVLREVALEAGLAADDAHKPELVMMLAHRPLIELPGPSAKAKAAPAAKEKS